MMRTRTLRFAPLLLAMVFAMVVSPPLLEAGYAGLSAAATLPAVLLGALISVSGTGRLGRIALLLWVATLLLDVSMQAPVGPRLPILSRLLDTAFLSFVFVVNLREVMRARPVTFDTVLGGLCGYLLLGFVFVSVYAAVELARPGSFADEGRALADISHGGLQIGRFPALVYYSFVTLTTLGYGDVAPVGALPRSLATLEAVVGQLYLTVLVAALVGMHLAQRPATAPPEDR